MVGKPFGLQLVDAPTRTLLQPSDVTYLGYYDLKTDGADSVYRQGLTHRYVNGQLRFLNMNLNGRLDEWTVAGKPFGALVTTRTRSWPAIGGLLGFRGFWWEESTQRLWSVAATDYTTTVIPTRIFTRTLNDDGTISHLHGPVSLEGISAKRVYGGVQPVPAWFQQQYGVGPYVAGFGGYTSLVNAGGGASIGPTLYALLDPAGFPDGATIPSNSFKTLMDYAPAGTYRGRRVTIPINYYDGGDPRPNPSTPPTVPPAAGARWLSPGPDGLGYWVWGDSYWNTGQWIDTPTKTGFLAIASLGGGKCYYMSSSLHSDKQQYELHIFDPATLGQSAQGLVKPSAVRPASMTELILPGLGGGKSGNGPTKNIGGATYDPISGRLYLMGYWTDKTINRLYVFQVAA